MCIKFKENHCWSTTLSLTTACGLSVTIGFKLVQRLVDRSEILVDSISGSSVTVPVALRPSSELMESESLSSKTFTQILFAV